MVKCGLDESSDFMYLQLAQQLNPKSVEYWMDVIAHVRNSVRVAGREVTHWPELGWEWKSDTLGETVLGWAGQVPANLEPVAQKPWIKLRGSGRYRKGQKWKEGSSGRPTKVDVDKEVGFRREVQDREVAGEVSIGRVRQFQGWIMYRPLLCAPYFLEGLCPTHDNRCQPTERFLAQFSGLYPGSCLIYH